MALSLKDKIPSGRKDVGDGPASEAGSAVLPRPGLADKIAGETAAFKTKLAPYLPPELIGGSIPHVPGMEDEAVWNAAAQACATEKVYYCYSIEGGRCWYLAVASMAMASNPDSWCPLAAALPGHSEFWDKETVYLYEQEGTASALRWDPETARMQVYIGASRTLLPRIQSMDANFVTINPDAATIVPWRNRALQSEKLARAAARSLMLAGLAVCFMSFFFLMIQYGWTIFLRRDLDKVRMDTEKASADLLVDAYNALQSDTIKHMVKIQDLLDTLRTMEGTLVKYQVEKNKTSWEALVPKSFSQGVGPVKGQIQPGIEKDGRVRLKGN
ncbi:MAG TPA: hypothetical protein VIF12_06120 [Micavibrio sp.]